MFRPNQTSESQTKYKGHSPLVQPKDARDEKEPQRPRFLKIWVRENINWGCELSRIAASGSRLLRLYEGSRTGILHVYFPLSYAFPFVLKFQCNFTYRLKETWYFVKCYMKFSKGPFNHIHTEACKHFSMGNFWVFEMLCYLDQFLSPQMVLTHRSIPTRRYKTFNCWIKVLVTFHNSIQQHRETLVEKNLDLMLVLRWLHSVMLKKTLSRYTNGSPLSIFCPLMQAWGMRYPVILRTLVLSAPIFKSNLITFSFPSLFS